MSSSKCAEAEIDWWKIFSRYEVNVALKKDCDGGVTPANAIACDEVRKYPAERTNPDMCKPTAAAAAAACGESKATYAHPNTKRRKRAASMTGLQYQMKAGLLDLAAFDKAAAPYLAYYEKSTAAGSQKKKKPKKKKQTTTTKKMRGTRNEGRRRRYRALISLRGHR